LQVWIFYAAITPLKFEVFESMFQKVIEYFKVFPTDCSYIVLMTKVCFMFWAKSEEPAYYQTNASVFY